MKTDPLFYELFRFDPDSLFRLAKIKTNNKYIFHSFTIKSTEKRLDGFFSSVDSKGPHYLLEVQGYLDKTIYWRGLREVSTYYEQTGDITPIVFVFLFLDKNYDPGPPDLLSIIPKDRLIRLYLIDELKKVDDYGSLTVLKPLAVESKNDIEKTANECLNDINSLNLPIDKENKLKELLIYKIEQRFPDLSKKEVERMLKLIPLEQTMLGKELIQMGEKQGVLAGIDALLKFRFGEMGLELRERIYGIDDLGRLRKIMEGLTEASNLDEVKGLC